MPDRRGHAPGVMLSREWAGVMHTVQVVEAGYAWNGAIYDSLSGGAGHHRHQVERARFFGLRAKATNSGGDASGRFEA